MKIKSIWSTIALNIAISVLVTLTYKTWFSKGHTIHLGHGENIPSSYVDFKGAHQPPDGDDNSFVNIAANTLPAIVQVKATAKKQINKFNLSPLDLPEGTPEPSLVMSGGSGVIIKDDGYIITNEH